MILRNTSALLSLVFLLAFSPAAQTLKPAELPDTPAGHRVAAYFKAFNSGEQAMRDFLAGNVAASALAQRPIDARIDFYRQMLGDMEAIEARRVVKALDNAVTVLAQTKRGEWFEFGFEFESAPPHKLLSLRVQDSEPPPERAAGKNDSPATMTEPALIEALGKYLDDASAADEFSGVVMIAKKDRPVFQKTCGLASKEYNIPVRIDTKFNLGSINKIFTQIAIGQLADQGSLSLDDKLGKHLPDYPNREAAEKVTIRQLLDMTSGIGDFFGPEFDATPKDRLRSIKDYLALFAAKPLIFEPGTKRQYSNGGYVVLGAIVEKVSRRDYYQYVREHIFKPADMRDTDWYEADIATPNLASGYTDEMNKGRGDAVRKSNIYTRPAKGSSAGGGYSTAPDLLKFVLALREGKLRVPSFRQPAAGQQRTAEQAHGGFAGVGIAGGAPGINAALEADEESGYTIIVLSNYDPPSAEKVARQIRAWIGRMKK